MIDYDLKKISAIAFDIDGVLSCSTIPMSPKGEPLRTVNIKDGYAIQLAQKMGLRIAIITGGYDEAIRYRYEKLGVEDIYMGCSVKIETWWSFIRQYDYNCENVIYVGDDIPDYEIMLNTACPCCPVDACADIKAIARYISPYEGGKGCGRDIIEQVLRAQGKWLTDDQAFGW